VLYPDRPGLPRSCSRRADLLAGSYQIRVVSNRQHGSHAAKTVTIGIAALRPNFASVTVSPAKIYTRTSGVGSLLSSTTYSGLAEGTPDGSRLQDIQHELCELIRALDPDRVRYPETDLRLA